MNGNPSQERLKAMAKKIMMADQENSEWCEELIYRTKALDKKNRIQLQEYINESTVSTK